MGGSGGKVTSCPPPLCMWRTARSSPIHPTSASSSQPRPPTPHRPTAPPTPGSQGHSQSAHVPRHRDPASLPGLFPDQARPGLFPDQARPGLFPDQAGRGCFLASRGSLRDGGIPRVGRPRVMACSDCPPTHYPLPRARPGQGGMGFELRLSHATRCEL